MWVVQYMQMNNACCLHPELPAKHIDWADFCQFQGCCQMKEELKKVVVFGLELKNLELGMLTLWFTEDYAAKCEYSLVSPQSLMAVTQLTLKLISQLANEACICVPYMYPNICSHSQPIFLIL